MQLLLQKFDFTVEYKKGTKIYLSDTLSRAYIKEHKQDVKCEVVLYIERSEVETEIELIQMIQYLAVSTERIAQLKEATKNDNALCALKQIIKTGWPESKYDVPKPIRLNHTFREELTFQYGIIFKGQYLIYVTDVE